MKIHHLLLDAGSLDVRMFPCPEGKEEERRRQRSSRQPLCLSNTGTERGRRQQRYVQQQSAHRDLSSLGPNASMYELHFGDGICT